MPPFTRNYFFGLQRLFRPSGMEVPQPSEISDVVNWTKNFQAWDFIHNIALRRSIQFTAGAGIDVQHDAPTPLPGYFQVPVSYTTWNNGAASQRVEVIMFQTGDPEDPWGNFDTLTRDLYDLIHPAAVGFFDVRQALVMLPLARGFSYRSLFAAVPIGNTVRTHYHWLDVPGELMTMELFAMKPGDRR